MIWKFNEEKSIKEIKKDLDDVHFAERTNNDIYLVYGDKSYKLVPEPLNSLQSGMEFGLYLKDKLGE